MEKNVIQINSGITINVDVIVKKLIYVKKIMFGKKYIMNKIICDEIIDVKETNFNEKNITCKA